MYNDVPIRSWKLITQASASVTAELTADVNTYALAYSGTWATCAQNPANRPALANCHRIDKGEGITNFRLRVGINHATDAEGKKAQLTLWGFDPGNVGGPMALVVLTYEGGTAAIGANPAHGITLGATDWTYADTIAEVTDNVNLEASTVANGIHEIVFANRGWQDLFADFDCNVDGSNVAADAFAIIKGY